MPVRRAAAALASPDEDESRTVRVLFLYDHLGYPNGLAHGMTRYCLSVLPRVNATPIELTACFLREEHPAGLALASAGVEPIFLGRAKWDPRAFLDVVTLAKRRRIDIVHGAGKKGILVGSTIARILGCRAIVHLHDLYPLSPPLRIALRATAGWSDVVLCVSEAVCQHALREYRVRPDQRRLLYNGIDPSIFAATPRGAGWRQATGIPPNAQAIGVIGRICAGKGHARLLRQMPRIIAHVPDAVMVVVGDGELRPQLHGLAFSLGIADAVHFVGQQNDMAAVLSALDVVAIPSDHEGLPFVALEAAAAGTPVVAAEVGGLREIMRHGETGLFFPLNNADLLGDALVTILRDPVGAARLAGAALREVARFGIDDHVRRLRDHYLRLASAGRQSPPWTWLRAS